MKARGTFEVQAQPEPPYHEENGVTLARTGFKKQLAGDLAAESSVQMQAARTPVQGSAVYVALEFVDGTLAGRRGSFVLAHLGVSNRGAQSQTVMVVPDSGTGELAGLSGAMEIRIEAGQHHYTFDYDLKLD